MVNRDVAQGRSRSVGIASSPKTVNGQNVRNLGTSSVGYARIETNQSNVTPSSIAPATLTLARPDLQGQAAARMKAAQREPLLQQQQALQQQLNDLLWNEPPRCHRCLAHREPGAGCDTAPLAADAATTRGTPGQALGPTPA